MSDLYDQIVSQRGSLERLAARLPGFDGYMERSARRAADRMLRDYLASQLTLRIERLNRIEKKLLDGGGMAYMSQTRSLKTRLQTYRDRVKTAAGRHSNFFEMVKIGPQELERIYSFDEAQLRYLERFDLLLDDFDKAAAGGEGVDDAIAALAQLAVEVNEAFAMRENLLLNLSESRWD